MPGSYPTRQGLRARLIRLIDKHNADVEATLDKLFRSLKGSAMQRYAVIDKQPNLEYSSMKDWIEKKLSNDWTVYYLHNDTETYLFEHIVCASGAVAYTDKVKECSQCKTPVPGKLLMVVQMVLKKDLLRV